MTQVGKFIKAQVYSPGVRAGDLKRELHTLGFGFLSLINGCKLGSGMNIPYLGQGFLGSSVLAFSSLFDQEFPVMAPTTLGLYGLIWFLVKCCQDRPLTFLIAGHGCLIAGLQKSC